MMGLDGARDREERVSRGGGLTSNPSWKLIRPCVPKLRTT